MCLFCQFKRQRCKPWICAVALIPLWRLYSESAGWAGSTACQLSRTRFLTAFCCICTCAFFANLRDNDANHEFAQWLWCHCDEIVQPWCGYGYIHRIVQSWGWEVPSLASKQKICWAWWNVCQERPVFAWEWQGSALQQMWWPLASLAWLAQQMTQVRSVQCTCGVKEAGRSPCSNEMVTSGW